MDKRIACDAGEASMLVDRLLAVDERRRELQVELEAFRGTVKESGQLVGLLRNSKSVGYKQAVASGKSAADIAADAERLQAELGEIKPKIKSLEDQEGPILEEFERLMLTIPQPTDPGLPVGKDDTENVELRTVGHPETRRIQRPGADRHRD